MPNHLHANVIECDFLYGKTIVTKKARLVKQRERIRKMDLIDRIDPYVMIGAFMLVNIIEICWKWIVSLIGQFAFP